MYLTYSTTKWKNQPASYLLEELNPSAFFVYSENFWNASYFHETKDQDEDSWANSEHTLQGVRPHYSL